jgi:hypothetical protein
MGAMTHTVTQKTYKHKGNIVISENDLDKLHKALSGSLLVRLSRFEAPNGREIYTDRANCIAEINKYQNGSAKILEVNLFGTEEKIKPLAESLSDQTAAWFYIRGKLSKLISEELSPEMLITKTYREKTKQGKWYDGLIQDLLKETYK